MNQSRTRSDPPLLPWLVILAVALEFVASPASAQPIFSDGFADRQLLPDVSGRIDGTNVGAGLEPDEPDHGGKPGGASVWISWVAPADGVATFWTDGSTFDTLLSAYYFPKEDETVLDKLREIARNDDDPTRVPAHTSLVQFGATAGTRYEIVVDGYRGEQGDIRLRWDFVSALEPPPIVVSVPDDRAARQGDTVTLTVDIPTSPNIRLQWRLNGNSFGAEGPTLVIPDLQPVNLGRYTLRIDLGDVRFETTPIELQINSDGQETALARDKLLDALESPLLPDDDNAVQSIGPSHISATAIGVSRGYNGTQIFDTTFATPDPEEPDHCGFQGGASYWYAYRPPSAGILRLDTLDSTFDTILAVYTYNPPFTGYGDLIPVVCDNDSEGVNGAALVEFPVSADGEYLVVVDGIAGARGLVHLNYLLEADPAPEPPTLVRSPSPVTVAEGGDAALEVEVTGSPPLNFAWFRGVEAIPGGTNRVLNIPDARANLSGDYTVVVSNDIGEPLSVLISLHVVTIPRIDFSIVPGGMAAFSFPSLAGHSYVLERTDSLNLPWQTVGDPFPGDGSSMVFTNDTPTGMGFFRLRVQ